MEDKMNYRQLVQEAISGNEESFNKLLISVQPASRFYAMSIARNEYIANEAMQLSSIKMYQSLSSLKDPDYFEGWYKRIVRNTTLDLLKKENREINFSAFDDEEDGNFEYNIADEKIDYQPELKFAQDEKEKMILDIVSDLPDNQRTPIMMYFYEDMKIKDIAIELAIPESTVKTRLTAGKKNIKNKVMEIQKRDGIKFYNVSPLGFFMWLLKGNAVQTITGGTAAAALAGTAAVASAAREGTILNTVFKSVIVKAMAGLTALMAIAGGTYIFLNNLNNNDTEKIEEEKIVEVIEGKADEEMIEESYDVIYNFVGKNNVPLPMDVLSRLPSNLTDQAPGTHITVSSFNDVKTENYIFHFEGWDKNECFIEDSDVTFTGTWSRTENIIRYNVYYQFVSKNGEAMPDSIYNLLPPTAVYKKGETVTAPYIANNIKGWTFKGWDHDSITLTDSDVTFTGTWRKEAETIKIDPEPVVEPAEEVEMKNVYVEFYAMTSEGGSWNGLPDDVLYYFPKEYHHQIIPIDAEPVLPSIEVGTIYNGWRYDGSIGGMGWKDNNDLAYFYQWSKIED